MSSSLKSAQPTVRRNMKKYKNMELHKTLCFLLRDCSFSFCRDASPHPATKTFAMSTTGALIGCLLLEQAFAVGKKPLFDYADHFVMLTLEGT